MAKTKDPELDTMSENLRKMQEDGIGNMMGLGQAWLEAMSEMSAEMATFLGKRLQKDLRTQQALLQCRTTEDFRQIQADFMRDALEQYQEETGKLVELGWKALTPKPETTG